MYLRTWLLHYNTLKIYDYSLTHRPPTVSHCGPVENEVVRLLKKYASNYHAEFVSDPKDADVLFTNGYFPENVRSYGKPLVKRMDGIFYREDLLYRNELHNEAAQITDHVIFISKYSQKTYHDIVGHPLKAETVVLNAVDPTEYPKKHTYLNTCKSLIAIATDWSRVEKRFQDTIQFASKIKQQVYVIGKTPQVSIPNNVHLLGYRNNYADVLTNMDAMVSFSYRDAAPKTVCQGIAVGLPIFYTDSGGQKEIVGNNGIDVLDPIGSIIEPTIPKLDMDLVLCRYENFVERFQNVIPISPYNCLTSMLDGYFGVFENAIRRHRILYTIRS